MSVCRPRAAYRIRRKKSRMEKQFFSRRSLSTGLDLKV